MIAYTAIRGPLGPPRADFYAAYQAMYTAAQYSQESVKFGEFEMPWVIRPPAPEEEWRGFN